MSILRLENISYGYIDGNNKRMILNNLDYTFERGKFYSILGPSGSGKTTLLAIAGGLEKAQEGNVYFEGKNVNDIGLGKYRRNNLSFVFQQFNLIPYLTAVENVVNVMEITNNQVPKPHYTTALNLLDQFGIVKTKAERSIYKLSGGEQQRVAIARGLATNVDLIMADEPTGNLDTATEQEIIKILRMLAKEYNKCVIVVTHSDSIAGLSDIQLKLVEGKLTERM
ncbi:ABC transporter ATP-binding protein [Vallitalea guaymasensis]|uniref:ABC transporter ATP-binding protein n=1 Tax=Vallitalea guaymasensis TaxID=1185412 RepID=A0A8J8ME94_9FIRM|nr:ABC transporter ATP-binding protein [Vallitalea guaymasensis]QUH31278.1 ABC transporter ATP-binding protein [Vallitalea guaymasensis]